MIKRERLKDIIRENGTGEIDYLVDLILDEIEKSKAPDKAGRGVGAESEDALCLRAARMFIGWPTDFAVRLEKVKTEAEAQVMARELADFLLRHREMARAATPTPALSLDSTGPVGEEAATDGPLFVHDFADPAVSSAPGPQDVTLSCDHPATITVAFMGNGMTGTLAEARANAAKLCRLWNAAPAPPTPDSTAQGDGTSQEGGR